ncbi:MAG: [LysW]-lysine hydrolase [Planctomycetota bacterium]|nr:MAG: [LysW]-lysine hydrolase [Planctomycetota bacterium]
MNDTAAIDLLEELVGTTSLSGAEHDAVALLVGHLSALGFDAHIDEAGNAVGLIGSGGPRVTLLGHIDTVPGHVPLRREGGRLYGRGAVDAKGPLVAFVAAAARAAQRGALGCRVELVACVDEEGASVGAQYRATLPAPDVCVVGEPSGWSGVTLGYKGVLDLSLTRREGVAHTAAEAPGVAALACRQFVALERAAATFDEGQPSLYERLLLHLLDLDLTSDGLFEQARLRLRLRLPPRLPPQRALEWVREQAPDWDVTAGEGLPAWDGPRTSRLAREFGRAIAAEGGRARFQRKTGSADMNVVAPAWGCPCLAYGPGDAALDHTPDEHIELDEFSRGVAVLSRWLAAPLGGAAYGPRCAPASVNEGSQTDM